MKICGSLSNDSSVAFPKYDQKGVWREESDLNIPVYVNGSKTATVFSSYEEGILNAYMTPDGRYLIAGVPSCVKVFKIKGK